MKRFFSIYVQDKFLFWLLILFSLWLVIPSSSYAHKVNIFAYAEGNQVYTESYFPNGRAVEGGTVEVYDSQKNKLITGTTDKEGKFNFALPKKDDLKIVLIASMGHKNSYLLKASELSDIVSDGELKIESGAEESPAVDEAAPRNSDRSSTGIKPSSQAQVSMQIDLRDIKKIIDQSLDQKLAPINRQLAKSQQERISPTEIFGGIGYIFGLFGLILYFTKRKA